jgi:hypothetical protein
MAGSSRTSGKIQKTTADVAIAAHRDFGLEKIIKAAELIWARPAKGRSLGLAASKTLNLMLGVAGSDGFQDRMYSIPKKDIRRSHKSNEHIPGILEELHTTLFRLETVSPRGKPAVFTAPLLSSTIVEIDDQDDDALIYFQFTPAFIAIHKDSRLWAALSGPIMIRFDSAYALRLYEIGCQLVGRHDPTMRLTVPELRELLQVPAAKYTDWANLRRKTLDAAVAEVNQLAPFVVTVPEDRIRRSGRKIVGLELRFFLKPDDEAADAARERNRHSAGRRARREGTVEDVVEPMALTSPEDLVLLWRKVRGLLERNPLLKKRPIKGVLDDLELVGVEDGEARLAAASGAVADQVNRNYDSELRRAFAVASGGTVRGVEVSAAREAAR